MAVVTTFVPAVANADVWVVLGAMIVGLAWFAFILVRDERP